MFIDPLCNFSDEFAFAENGAGRGKLLGILGVSRNLFERHAKYRGHILDISTGARGASVVHIKILYSAIDDIDYLAVLSAEIDQSEIIEAGLDYRAGSVSLNLRNDFGTGDIYRVSAITCRTNEHIFPNADTVEV